MFGVAVLAQLAATSPAPGPSSFLADAPSFTWIEADRSADVLEGRFTAEEYAAYVQTGSSTPNSVAASLNSLGFVQGFGREWGQIRTENYLVERVFQFRDSSGAGTWFKNIQAESKASSAYIGDLPEASSIPSAFGVVMKLRSGGRQWRIDFRQDDFVFVVHADADTDDMSSLAVGQARAIYNLATGVAPPTRSSGTVPALPSWGGAAIAGMAALVIVAIVAGGAAAILFARGQSRRPALAPAIQMSPDNNYWWDGVSWRDAGLEVPPAAQRSPDGAYWWDGTQWRSMSTHPPPKAG